jgi:hypothetical protein
MRRDREAVFANETLFEIENVAPPRHREEQRDEAIQLPSFFAARWIASLRSQ